MSPTSTDGLPPGDRVRLRRVDLRHVPLQPARASRCRSPARSGGRQPAARPPECPPSRVAKPRGRRGAVDRLVGLEQIAARTTRSTSSRSRRRSGRRSTRACRPACWIVFAALRGDALALVEDDVVLGAPRPGGSQRSRSDRSCQQHRRRDGEHAEASFHDRSPLLDGPLASGSHALASPDRRQPEARLRLRSHRSRDNPTGARTKPLPNRPHTIQRPLGGGNPTATRDRTKPSTDSPAPLPQPVRPPCPEQRPPRIPIIRMYYGALWSRASSSSVYRPVGEAGLDGPA